MERTCPITLLDSEIQKIEGELTVEFILDRLV